jgi:hypothetical protein
MAASKSTQLLILPHPDLTLTIAGKPTHKMLQLLQKELYDNARAVHLARGGGANGHLAITMPASDYLARNQIEFVSPVHSGVAPVHPVNATGNQIINISRQFEQNIFHHQFFLTVREALKQQILLAVDFRYFHALEDADMGFSNLTCAINNWTSPNIFCSHSCYLTEMRSAPF